jgi:hypothetical protein
MYQMAARFNLHSEESVLCYVQIYIIGNGYLIETGNCAAFPGHVACAFQAVAHMAFVTGNNKQ